MKAKRLLSGLISAVMAVSATISMISFTVSADDTFDELNQQEITAAMGAGWNLGNQLEASADGIPNETTWGNPVITKELLQTVKKAGYKSVRIPVSYLDYIGEAPDYTINADWLARVKEVVDYAIDAGLYVFINMHGDGYTTVSKGWLMSTPESSGIFDDLGKQIPPVPYTAEEQEEVNKKFGLVWQQIANTFVNYDEHLVFESMNEVFDGTYTDPKPDLYENINTYNQIFVDSVRATGGNNAKRWLLVPGWNTNIDYTTGDYGFEIPTDENRDPSIPEDEQRIMISVHDYDPWDFNGDGTSLAYTQWGSNANPSKVTSYSNTEEAMETQIKKVYDKFVTAGYPVVIGEYGTINKTSADPVNTIYRAHYAETMCALSKEYGCIPVYWDNGAVSDSFGLINRNTCEIEQPEIIDAMMEVYLTPEENVNRYIDKISELDSTNYTDETWGPLNTAVEAAKTLVEAGTASDDELLEAYNAITDAFYKLMPSDTAQTEYIVGVEGDFTDSASTPISEQNDKNFSSIDDAVIDLSTSNSLVIKYKILEGEPADSDNLLILKPYSNQTWDGWNDNFITKANSTYNEETGEYTYAVNTQDILASYTGSDSTGAKGINLYYAILEDTPNIQVTYYSISYAYQHSKHHFVITDETFSCAEDGERIFTCTACGETYKEAFKATGHKWGEWTIIKPATCTEDGKREHTCSVCNETVSTTIRATGHKFVNGVCTVCGANESNNGPANSNPGNNNNGGNTVNKATTAPTSKVTPVAPKTTSKAQAKKAMKKAKIKKVTLKSKGKKITVKWKKVSKANGYQVQVSANKKFKKVIVNKKSVKKTNITIKSKKLKKGKTYYVRVRAFANYGKSGKANSAWKKLGKVKFK